MGSLFRSEEVCLAQLFLQAGSAYDCVSELGEIGLVEFRDLNQNVNAFQRRFVGEVRRCEDMEKTFSFLEQEVRKADMKVPVQQDNPLTPSYKDSLKIQDQSEQLAQELREVSRNRDSLRNSMREMEEYSQVLKQTQQFTGQVAAMQSMHTPVLHRRVTETDPLLDSGQASRLDVHLSFVAGVIHPWKVNAFERLLWRACRGYMIVNFAEMSKPMEDPATGDMINWVVFHISYWGEQIGQKVKKICSCYHCHTYDYPDTEQEQQLVLQGLLTRIEDLKSVLNETEEYLRQVLQKAVQNLHSWIVQAKKMKAVYMVLNQCSFNVTEKCLIAEVWCPVSDLRRLQEALIQGSQKSGAGVQSIVNRIPTAETPPTLIRTNKFTSGFQNIVDAYGVGSYREVNPAPYTIITFPFLFAVMFGDLGHGLLMFMFALWMVVEENNPNFRNSTNEIWNTFFGGRYLILLMGAFSVYTGFIYNESFSVATTIFASGWNVSSMFTNGDWTMDTLKGNAFLTLDPNITGVFTRPYPFGIDPIWSLSQNHLNFLNSFKMKMSVILGIVHMTFGVLLGVFNHVHFKKPSNILLVFIPEIIFMLFLFGYLVVLIFYKWIVYSAINSRIAPSILIHFIDMFLFTSSKDNPDLYKGQVTVQMVLVILALVCVPFLLFGKPLYLLFRHWSQHRIQRGYSHLDGQNAEEARPLLNDARKRGGSINSDRADEEHGGTHEEEFVFSEEFMHQAIHTIEYCLGCISNTASYLRLWALSLAHAQLSEVLWGMVMAYGLTQRYYYGGVILAVIFAFFGVLTVSILLLMEGLSAFLHALRLHWVEFQNKFYTGCGYKLSPFSFCTMLESIGQV